MSDLLLILLGTFLVCASAGFIWSRWERNHSPDYDNLQDWPPYPLDDPNEDSKTSQQ